MYCVKYNRFPNNEIRVTLWKQAPKKQKYWRPILLWVELIILLCASPDSGCQAASAVPSLDISSDLSQSPREKKRVRTKFGVSAKRTLLRIGGAYDTLDSDPSKFIFLTGTVPGGTHEAFSAIAEESTFVVQRISDWLSRTAPSDHWFYVWELQKRGALHIHYCVYPNDSSAAQKILDGWKAKWQDILDKIGSRRQVDMWKRADGTHHKKGKSVLQAYSQRVRLSVAAYLSGYCGSDKNKHALDKDSLYYPSRWWGASRRTTALLKSLTEEILKEYSSYRDARQKMDVWENSIPSNTPIKKRYPHKVGIGETCVSFHPEDKGKQQWQLAQKMTFNHKNHPNVQSMIHVCQKLSTYLQPYCKPSENLSKPVSKRLLQDLQDFLLWESLSRSMLNERHLRILKNTVSALGLKQTANPHQNECLRLYKLLTMMLEANSHEMQWNQYGWLINLSDLPNTVDTRQEFVYLGTNPDEGDAQPGGVANGSLSPQASPSQLSLFD